MFKINSNVGLLLNGLNGKDVELRINASDENRDWARLFWNEDGQSSTTL